MRAASKVAALPPLHSLALRLHLFSPACEALAPRPARWRNRGPDVGHGHGWEHIAEQFDTFSMPRACRTGCGRSNYGRCSAGSAPKPALAAVTCQRFRSRSCLRAAAVIGASGTSEWTGRQPVPTLPSRRPGNRGAANIARRPPALLDRIGRCRLLAAAMVTDQGRLLALPLFPLLNRNTVTKPVVIGLLAFWNRNIRFRCYALKWLRCARFIDICYAVTV